MEDGPTRLAQRLTIVLPEQKLSGNADEFLGRALAAVRCPEGAPTNGEGVPLEIVICLDGRRYVMDASRPRVVPRREVVTRLEEALGRENVVLHAAPPRVSGRSQRNGRPGARRDD
jgi:hypothetical protein